jgi:hypothetical protein
MRVVPVVMLDADKFGIYTVEKRYHSACDVDGMRDSFNYSISSFYSRHSGKHYIRNLYKDRMFGT